MKLTFFNVTSSLILIGSSLASADGFNQDLYQKLNPLSVKYCAVSQVHRIGEATGGPYGHAVTWLDDVCLDTSVAYPKVRRCTLSDKVKGVGISVNKVFANVNWVAIPGHDLFFYGDLEQDAPINANVKNELAQKAARLGFHAGIQLHKKLSDKKPADMDLLGYTIDNSLDTDFALNWGRDLYCVNIPVNSEMLDRAVVYANLMNSRYASEKDFTKIEGTLNAEEKRAFEFDKKSAVDKYHWNGLTDNCAHFAYNLVASMGLVHKKTVVPIPFLSPAGPADRLVHLFRDGNENLPENSEDIANVFRNKVRNDLLLQDDWIFPHEGVVMEVIPMHQKNNTLFIHTDVLKTLDFRNGSSLQKLKTQTDLQDVAKNISGFEARYQAALENAEKMSAAKILSQGDSLQEFFNRYVSYLKQRAQSIQLKVKMLPLLIGDSQP